jgi:hypothetical protein
LTLESGNTKGGKYHRTVDLLFDWFGISCMTTDNNCFYLQNRLIQTSQTGGQWYNDTSPFSIPCTNITLTKISYTIDRLDQNTKSNNSLIARKKPLSSKRCSLTELTIRNSFTKNWISNIWSQCYIPFYVRNLLMFEIS